MLMYRKVTGKEECYKFSDEQVPEYLRSLVDEETEKMIAEQKALEEKILALKLKVHLNNEQRTLNVKKSMLLSELIQLALAEFGADLQVEDCRMRAYDPLMKIQEHVDNP